MFSQGVFLHACSPSPSLAAPKEGDERGEGVDTPGTLERELSLIAPAMRDEKIISCLYDTDETRHCLRLEVLMGVLHPVVITHAF